LTIEAGRDEPAGALLAAVRELGAALDAFDEAAARALGIGRSDLRALNLLEHGPVAAGALAATLSLSSGAVTALVDRLVHAGYVERVADPGDRRRVLVQLRPQTYAAFARVYAPCGRAVAGVGEDVGPRSVTTARRVLAAVTAAVRSQVPELSG
jgi:DNA-binding MarR family transcriptional regulator